MLLTNDQCEKLRDAILNVYPYENKATLESLLINEFNVKLEFKINYSYPIQENDSNKVIQEFNKKIKILFFQTNPKNLNLNKEFSVIESAIERASNRSLFDKPIFKPVYSIDDIRRAIADEKPHIVHFCGHALENGSLKLENDSNELFVSPEILKSIFEGRKDIIKCVLLNACYSAEATVAISEYIDYSIGMNNQIIDGVAIEFAKGFYDGLGYDNNNKDIFLTAFYEGIRAIIAHNISSQKTIPLLRKRISYEDAVLKVIKNINSDYKIDKFIKKIKSLPIFFNDKLFIRFYVDYSYPIKKNDLNELLEILRAIEDQHLAKIKGAYRETLPQYSTIDNTELNNCVKIDYIIDILQTKYPFVDVGNNKVPSILEFAKNLAGKFEENSEQYQALKNWIKEVSSTLEISILVQPKNINRSTTNQTTFLFIIIHPEHDKLRLETQFILDKNQQLYIQPFDLKQIDNKADDKGIVCDSFEHISQIIEKIIKEFTYYFFEQITELIIEIFLPYKYLGKNLDNKWCIQDENGKKTIRIVQEYKMILHPIERFIQPRSFQHFRQGWERINQVLKSQSNTSSILEDIEIVRKIDDNNHEQSVVNLRKKIGVKITSPLQEQEKDQDSFWRAVLRGGTPLAFWTRCHSHMHINLDDIDGHLTGECLINDFQQLVDDMHSIRQNAYCQDNPEEYLGYYLGFLCDNPSRKPTIKPLKPF